MAFRASSLEDVGDIMINVFDDFRRDTARELFENLMETTPEATGTLKANWKAKPGSKAGKTFIINTGKDVAEQPVPDFDKYIRNWKVFTIYNNSPYIVHVNNGESGNEHNQNFIQAAMAMTKNA